MSGELIRETVKEQCGRDVSIWEAERIYRFLKKPIASEFYNEDFSRVTSGIHFLYFTAVVFLVSSLCTANWKIAIWSTVFLILSLLIDVYFEREELLYFVANKKKVAEEVARLRDHPSYGVK